MSPLDISYFYRRFIDFPNNFFVCLFNTLYLNNPERRKVFIILVKVTSDKSNSTMNVFQQCSYTISNRSFFLLHVFYT